MAAIGGSSILPKLQLIFAKRLPQRCQEIDELIRKTNVKELKNCLPYIVENIFMSQRGWELDKISKPTNPAAFQSVRRFLSPEGQLLNLIYSLQADIYLQYEFQISNIPAPSRHLIEEGAIPLFYVNKLRQDGFGQTYLALGAFEYFMFHFAYYLINPLLQKTTVSWINFYDYLYPSLVDDYLKYFFPLDKKSLPPMPHMSVPVRSPLSQYAISSNISPVRINPTPQQHSSRPSLFKTSFTAMQKQHVQGSPVLEQGEAETWRSETILQVFAEFWLNQNSHDMGRAAIFSQSSPERFMPTHNHAKIVRCLVKHLHFFTNTASEVISSPYHHAVPTPLDVFKRTTVPQIMQKKLYGFLRYTFDKWPLDSSFRWILEGWLSYIQPWRYVDPQKLLMGSEYDLFGTLDRHVDDRWEQFVEDNLLFYTVLFQRFIIRVYRFDLTSMQSANMLFRVTKVMNLPNLPALIFKAERELFGSFQPTHVPMTPDLGNSYLSGLPQITMPLPPQLSEFEHPSFQYQPMFGDAMSRTIQELIQLILQAYHTVQMCQVTPRQEKSGFWDWLISVFTDSDLFAVDSALERKRTIQLLEMSMKNLSSVYELPFPSQLPNQTLPLDTSAQTSCLDESQMPDCVETEHGPELTDLGKYQIIKGLRKFNISCTGDPEMQPVRGFENATVVKILRPISSFINFQFGDKIEGLYNRKDLLGKLAKVYLCPPLRPRQKITSPMSKTTAKILKQPRLSLRFLASYYNLGGLFALFVILCVIGGGPMSFLFVLLLIVLLYGLVATVMKTNTGLKED